MLTEIKRAQLQARKSRDALQESRIQQMHEIDTRAAQLEADHLI